MSLYDVTKLGGIGPIRGVTRELSGEKPLSRSEPAQGPVDRGVSVETAAALGARDVPVDAERVEQIRAALRNGSYPLVPARIADAIIAARHMLSDGQ